MIYKLVCAGDNCFNDLYLKDEDEVIIAIDGGYQVLKDNNIKIDYFFGDFDSLEKSDIESDNVFVYPSVKDDSDFDLAINYLINNLNINKDDVLYVYNATGGRLDHFYAILNTIKKYKDYNIKIFDKNNCIFISDYEMNFKKDNYKYISFFSIENESNITLNGFKYNIDNYLINNNDNICLSNEIIKNGYMKCNKKVLVILSK